MASSAQVSEATTHVPLLLPRQSGRFPMPSLTATSWVGVAMVRQNDPDRRGITWRTLSSIVDPGADAIRSAITAESVVAASSSELSSVSPRKARAFTMFPLWPSAMGPISVLRSTGCMLEALLDPAVEYLQCPIATLPLRRANRCSENTRDTRPMRRSACIRCPSPTAMPALSWPRCWTANSAK